MIIDKFINLNVMQNLQNVISQNNRTSGFLFKRYVSFWVDFFITSLPRLILVKIANQVVSVADYSGLMKNIVLFMFWAPFLSIGLLYEVFMLSRYNQTVGMKLMKYKIYSKNGEGVKKYQIILREMFFYIECGVVCFAAVLFYFKYFTSAILLLLISFCVHEIYSFTKGRFLHDILSKLYIKSV